MDNQDTLLEKIRIVFKEEISAEIKAERIHTKNLIREEILGSENRLRKEIQGFVRASESKLEDKIEKTVKGSEVRLLAKVDASQEDTIKVLSEVIDTGYTMSEKRIKKLEEILDIVESHKN